MTNPTNTKRAIEAAFHWPKAIQKGVGTRALFYDERATAPLREALLQICSARVAGAPHLLGHDQREAWKNYSEFG